MPIQSGIRSWKAIVSMAAASCVAACGAIPFPFDDGAMMNVEQVPTETMGCDRDSWEPVSRKKPNYKSDYLTYLFILEGEEALRGLDYSFDLNPGAGGVGRPVNIRFDGPMSYLDNDGTRPAIKANGEAIAKWTYRWIGEGAPVYARDCRITIELVMRRSTPLE